MGPKGYLETSATDKPRCVKSKKSEDVVYTATEASNHANAGLISCCTSAEIRDHFRTNVNMKAIPMLISSKT